MARVVTPTRPSWRPGAAPPATSGIAAAPGGRSDRTVHAEACAAVLSGVEELCACAASTDVTRVLVEGAAEAATEAARRPVERG